jgi:hypothetical protein
MWSKPALRVAAALLSVLALGACANSAAPLALPEITFQHLGSFQLDVAQIEVLDEYVPPLKPPYVEHLFSSSPANVAVRWGRDRLKAVGTSRKARFIVRDAPVSETPLDVEEGLEGALTTDQSERYQARLSVLIEIVSEERGREAYVEASAVRVRSVPEDTTLNERQRLFHAMTGDLMADLNAALERNILEHLGKYVR